MNKPTLMIIDDEPDLLDIIAEQIDAMGFEVSVLKCSTVEEAQSNINSCDIILSDVNMPGRDRLEYMLKNTTKPVARITGHDELRGDLVIVKPYKNEDFKRVINKLLEMVTK
jgi:DNA-binding NtrC family response regulator